MFEPERRVLLALTAGLTVALALLSPGAPSADAAAPMPRPRPVPVVIGVQAEHRAGGDQVVLTFDGGLPPTPDPSWVGQLADDPSGRPVLVPGAAVLEVRLRPARAHDASGHPTLPAQQSLGLTDVVALVTAGDFAGTVTLGVVAKHQSKARITALHHPDRLLVQVDLPPRPTPTLCRPSATGTRARAEHAVSPLLLHLQEQATAMPMAPAANATPTELARRVVADLGRLTRLVAAPSHLRVLDRWFGHGSLAPPPHALYWVLAGLISLAPLV